MSDLHLVYLITEELLLYYKYKKQQNSICKIFCCIYETVCLHLQQCFYGSEQYCLAKLPFEDSSRSLLKENTGCQLFVCVQWGKTLCFELLYEIDHYHM